MALTGILLAACSHDVDLYEGGNNGNNGSAQKELKPESEYLNFNTTNVVNLKLNYGEMGQRILLNVYTSNPLVDDEENATSKLTGTPVFKAYTDENGVFEGHAELPTYVNKLYITTDSWGVKRFAEVAISNGKAEADLAAEGALSRTVTRASGNYKIWDLGSVGSGSNKISKLYSIVGWDGNAYGKITDGNNGLLTKGSLTANDLKIIKPHLGNGTTSTFSDKNNYASTDMVNTSIAATFKNEKGETVVTESAQVYVTYVGEMGAWFQDGLGYYYYKTGEAPASRNDALAQLKHYIVLPNSSLPADAPYLGSTIGKNGTNYYNYGEENAPAWANERVQLLFEDPATGEISTKFPPGYTIGFFLFSKGNYGNNNCADATYKIKTDYLWYSNVEWNTDSRKYHFSALGYKDKIIYGVEDGQNQSYNDLVFTVEADPTGSIVNESRNIIPIEVPEEDATEETCRTYAFEDIWPNGGDYDMNDVIVEHRRSVTFDSYNYVKEVVDSFLPKQPAGAADYNDGFAIQIPANQRGDITLPTGAVDETETNSIILFKSAKNQRGKWFVIKRTFSGKELTKVGLEDEDNNPFIIANYKSDENRIEVHLPKHKSTSKANQDQIGSEDDAYFVNKDGAHPFSIKLPVKDFQPVTEQCAIEVEYPDFTKWVESKMTQYLDWYLNYVKKN